MTKKTKRNKSVKFDRKTARKNKAKRFAFENPQEKESFDRFVNTDYLDSHIPHYQENE